MLSLEGSIVETNGMRRRDSSVVVTLEVDGDARAIFGEVLGDLADVVFLGDLPENARAGVLAGASVIISRNTAKELRPGEDALIGGVRLLQFVTAGVDYIPLRQLPATLPIAANGGAYSEPMAEHAVAMAFAAAKRLIVEHKKLERGTFDQFRPNRMLTGRVCGILGYGGVGEATARRMRALGLKVHAINRRGVSEEPIDWIGTPDKLDELLAASDVLVIAVRLLAGTDGLIGGRELALMKPDAILVNLARGEIVDEAALYAHLRANPQFIACIDAWWVEPVRHNRFEMGHPFMELENVIASPHNSASVANARPMAYRQASINCRRVLEGKPARHLVGLDARMR
jgi:phosphoglycerate dehydrogenase-like enzyme